MAKFNLRNRNKKPASDTIVPEASTVSKSKRLKPNNGPPCCICVSRINSVDIEESNANEYNLLRLFVDCMGNSDTVINSGENDDEEKVQFCWRCKSILESWKSCHDQEIQFRTQAQKLKSTLTAFIVESRGKRNQGKFERVDSVVSKIRSHVQQQYSIGIHLDQADLVSEEASSKPSGDAKDSLLRKSIDIAIQVNSEELLPHLNQDDNVNYASNHEYGVHDLVYETDPTSQALEPLAFSVSSDLDQSLQDMNGYQDDVRENRIILNEISPGLYQYGEYSITESHGRFWCITCSKEFPRKDSILHHIRSMHMGLKIHSIHVVEVGPDTYMYRNQVPFTRQDKTYQCGLCSFQSSNPLSAQPSNEFFRHLTNEHLKDSPDEGPTATGDGRTKYRFLGVDVTVKDGEHTCGACSRAFKGSRATFSCKRHIHLLHQRGPLRKKRRLLTAVATGGRLLRRKKGIKTEPEEPEVQVNGPYNYQYLGVPVELVEGKHTCGSCLKCFEGNRAKYRCLRHITLVHGGIVPWSQGVTDIGEGEYLYLNQIPFSFRNGTGTCGICSKRTSGGLAKKSMLAHITVTHRQGAPQSSQSQPNSSYSTVQFDSFGADQTGESLSDGTFLGSSTLMNSAVEDSRQYYNVGCVSVRVEDGKHVCEACGKTFEGSTGKSLCQRHINAVHLGITRWSNVVRDVGDGQFLYKEKIQFSGGTRNGFLCGVCGHIAKGTTRGNRQQAILNHIVNKHQRLFDEPIQIPETLGDEIVPPSPEDLVLSHLQIQFDDMQPSYPAV